MEGLEPTAGFGPPPAAPRDPSVRSVSVRKRRPAPALRSTVSVHYAQHGERRHRVLDVVRPLSFDEVVLSVVDGYADPPTTRTAWPGSLRAGARLALNKARDAHAALTAPLRDVVPMYDVRAHGPNNMSHLLLEILPLCLFAQETLEGRVKCVFDKVHGPFREALDVLCVDCVFTSRRLAGDLVQVCGTRGFAVYDLLHVFDCPSITFLPDAFDRFTFRSPVASERVFIARRGARSLKNHAEVERLLSARGYATVYLEDYPVEHQFGIAAQARHVVGIHGAGLATLVMNKGLASVIELMPPHAYHQHYPMCLAGRVQRYVMLMPEYDEAVQHSGWQALLAYKSAPFEVDLYALECALEEAHN